MTMLDEKRQQGKFTVVDVGGMEGGWCSRNVDSVIDINIGDTLPNFQVDICVPMDWFKVMDFVKVNGKFDYCICSHTLEDVYNPYTAMQVMPLIAKAGVIMVPYYQTELSHVESSKYLGYMHHRYMFKEKDGKILLAPKLPFLEKIDIKRHPPELVNFKIEWKGSIEYDVFMNNYLGPTTPHISNNYTAEFGQ